MIMTCTISWDSDAGEWGYVERRDGVPVNRGLLTNQADEPEGYGDNLESVAACESDLVSLAHERLDLTDDCQISVEPWPQPA